jgi:hypothetical protein
VAFLFFLKAISHLPAGRGFASPINANCPAIAAEQNDETTPVEGHA